MALTGDKPFLYFCDVFLLFPPKLHKEIWIIRNLGVGQLPLFPRLFERE